MVSVYATPTCRGDRGGFAIREHIVAFRRLIYAKLSSMNAISPAQHPIRNSPHLMQTQLLSLEISISRPNSPLYPYCTDTVWQICWNSPSAVRNLSSVFRNLPSTFRYIPSVFRYSPQLSMGIFWRERGVRQDDRGESSPALLAEVCAAAASSAAPFRSGQPSQSHVAPGLRKSGVLKLLDTESFLAANDSQCRRPVSKTFSTPQSPARSQPPPILMGGPRGVASPKVSVYATPS